MQSHIRKVYACLAVTCYLHFWQNDRDLLRATAVTHGGGTDTEIRVSTESRPWRRKFSRRSCRDLNPRPFSHESGALTTELSLPPSVSVHSHIPLLVRFYLSDQSAVFVPPAPLSLPRWTGWGPCCGLQQPWTLKQKKRCAHSDTKKTRSSKLKVQALHV